MFSLPANVPPLRGKYVEERLGTSDAINARKPGAAFPPLDGPAKTVFAAAVAVFVPPFATGKSPVTPVARFTGT